MHEFLVVVDGLHKVSHQNNKFLRELHAFLSRLLERNFKVKVLLTINLHGLINEVFIGLPNIEYDKERKGLMWHYILNSDPY